MTPDEPSSPGDNFKNFTPPADAPDTFNNEGAGGNAAEPEQIAPPSPEMEPQQQGPGLTPFQQQYADFWHAKGMSDAGIAGMLGTAHYEAPQGWTSFNPDSGASGAYQYLGSRAEQEKAYAQAHQLDPWHPDAQNGFAYSEIQPGGSQYDIAGKYLWGATNPAIAADIQVRGFERPGPEATPVESHAAQRMAMQLYPMIQARYAKDAGPPPDPQGVSNAYDRLLKSAQPTGQGAFDHQMLPPTVTAPQPTDLHDAYDNLLKKAQQGTIQEKQKEQAPVPPGYDWGSLGSALKEVVRGVPMGFLTRLGLPADTFNFVNHYYEQHPNDAALVGLEGVPPSLMGLQTDPKTTAPTPEQPQAFRVPLGTEDLAKAVKYVTGREWLPGYENSGLDLRQQDTSIGGDIGSDIGQFIGAGATPIQDIPAAARWLANPTSKTLLSGIVHHILMPAGVSGGLDAGRWAVDKYSPDQGTANAIGIGARMALGGVLLGAMGRAGAAKTAIQEGLTPRAQIDRAFTEAYGGDTAAAARAKATAASELDQYNPEDYAPGYRAPAALRTSATPLQQLFHDNMQLDMELRGRRSGNIAAMEGMQPEGNADNAITAVQNSQDARQQMIDHRVDLAKEIADQKLAAASIGSNGRVLSPGDAATKFDLGQEYVNQLNAARDDAFAHADNQWDVAREHGYLDAQAPVTSMYGKLGEEMSKNIQQRQGADFPWQIVKDLYSTGSGTKQVEGGIINPATNKPITYTVPSLVPGGGVNPQTALFDAYGNRLTKPSAFPVLKEGNVTLDDLKAIDSRLGNAIRMEQDRIAAPGNGGNPALLRNAILVRNHIWDAIQQGAANAGHDHTVALQNAMNATATAYNTFVTGGLNKVLNEHGGAAIAPQEISRYLGNSTKAVNAADATKRAFAQRTGAAAARAGNPSVSPQALQTQAWNSASDWLRQDYLDAYHDLSPGTGQKWLANHQGWFDRLKGNPVMDQLNQELQAHVASDNPGLTRTIKANNKTEQADLDRNAASIFLGNPQARINAVLNTANPGAAMRELIDTTMGSDPTGNAFRGLQRMLWDRVQMAAERQNDPLEPGAPYYSGRQAKAFVDSNKAAFDAMRQADPNFGKSMDRLVNSLAIEDRARINPRLPLSENVISEKGGFKPGEDLATRGFQLGVGALARRVLTKFPGMEGMVGGMAATGQASAYARGLAKNVISPSLRGKINSWDMRANARKALEDALFDPEKLRGLLAPMTGASGQKWAAGVEPWLRAGGVMLPQGFLNPEQPQQQDMTMSAPSSFNPPSPSVH